MDKFKILFQELEKAKKENTIENESEMTEEIRHLCEIVADTTTDTPSRFYTST